MPVSTPLQSGPTDVLLVPALGNPADTELVQPVSFHLRLAGRLDNMGCAAVGAGSWSFDNNGRMGLKW